MEVAQIKKYVQDNNVIDRDVIAKKTACNVTKVIKEKESNGKVDLNDPQTLTYILSRTISEAISITLEESIPALGFAICNQMKEDMKKEVLEEAKAHLHMQTATMKYAVTKKMIKSKYDLDKREAYDRRSNLIFSGIGEDQEEKKNPRLTRDKLVNILTDLGCRISREDISACHRVYRKNTTNGSPNMVICRFVSRQVRDEVLGFAYTYSTTAAGRYINEDMTPLQRKLFYFLRQKEDIVIKKTVAFKDGNIICLLKKNENDKRWSKIESALDLVYLDKELELDIHNHSVLEYLGLDDCEINLNLE